MLSILLVLRNFDRRFLMYMCSQENSKYILWMISAAVTTCHLTAVIIIPGRLDPPITGNRRTPINPTIQRSSQLIVLNRTMTTSVG